MVYAPRMLVASPLYANADGFPWVTVLVGVTAFWVVFWIYVWIRYFPTILRIIGEAPMLVADESKPLAGGDECEFRTSDGLMLRGTYLKHTAACARRGVILFAHELNGDRWNATPYVRDLVAAGYDVLTFDYRNHGTSDAQPNLLPSPWISPNELCDTRAAVDHLMARADADPRGIGILGISRGAGASLCVAAEDSRVRCLFTDGAYAARLTHLYFFKRYLDIYIPYPWSPYFTGILPDWVFEAFLGAARVVWGRRNHFQFVPVEQFASRVQAPVLMMHGERDRMIPVEAARALRKRIKAPAKLVVVAGAKHNGAVVSDSERYLRRLRRFFDLHLASREARRESRLCESGRL
ncbi:MAG: hypothetical protein C0483_11865 [Pirellula sp.]|nr:hypothetical protein [Pirellula sp.]